MSTTAPSRATLADVIELISKADLPERQRQDMRSAVHTIARLLGTEPAAIAVEPAALRRRLDELSPGLSRGRWANIRSLLGKAIALARPILPSRTVAPLSPEWEALAAVGYAAAPASLPQRPRDRAGRGSERGPYRLSRRDLQRS